MPSLFQQRLEIIRSPRVQPSLRGIVRGIEKESLRVAASGQLAQTPHPRCMGSALTNPYITTDYSEALLEFITPPCHSIDELLHYLDNIHRSTYQCLGEEFLWTASMPCILRGDEDIPVAHYGDSNIGRMKTIYRIGLGHRYGRAMQAIAGIHYNFSLDDKFWLAYQRAQGDKAGLQQFKNINYLALIRNFRRYAWLLIYLFGASPALCKSFIGSKQHTLDDYDDSTLYSPGATSLRMGDLGYQSSAQEDLQISYNSLEGYIASIEALISRQHPAYQAIGTKDANGEWIQLSTALLQIENEFYSTVRPKQLIRSGEAPLRALGERGIEYVEVRALDVNPYTPLGIDAEQIRFLDTFLIYCLLEDSPDLEPGEYHETQRNLTTVVNHGRAEGVMLEQGGNPASMTDWANSLFDNLEPIAELLDADDSGDDFASALAAQRAKLTNTRLTPSGQIMADLDAEDLPWFHFAMDKSMAHGEYFLKRPLREQEKAFFDSAAVESLAAQHRIEQSDHLSFDEFLTHYYQQYPSPSP